MSSTVTRTTRINGQVYTREVAGLTVRELASIVQGQAKALAPVGLSGDLSNSITITEINRVEYEVGPTVGYGVYVEFGTGDQGTGGGSTWTYWSDDLQQFVTTSGMRAQPFLRPALDFVRKRAWRVWKKFSEGYGR